jgi:hypothetical protein
MTERDRKQIVAEVLVVTTALRLLLTLLDRNILKDLCHENIVRYHDRVRLVAFLNVPWLRNSEVCGSG